MFPVEVYRAFKSLVLLFLHRLLKRWLFSWLILLLRWLFLLLCFLLATLHHNHTCTCINLSFHRSRFLGLHRFLVNLWKDYISSLIPKAGPSSTNRATVPNACAPMRSRLTIFPALVCSQSFSSSFSFGVLYTFCPCFAPRLSHPQAPQSWVLRPSQKAPALWPPRPKSGAMVASLQLFTF